MSRSHLNNTHTPRYRPIFSSARRATGHSSGAYGARGPTLQSGKWAITLRAVSDFPPGRYNGSLQYSEYNCVAVAPPDRKITGSGTHGYY
jgi:hypothetical protein